MSRATVKTKYALSVVAKASKYFLSSISDINHNAKISEKLGIVKYVKNKNFILILERISGIEPESSGWKPGIISLYTIFACVRFMLRKFC